MYDATKVIIGLAFFLGLVTLPFWASLGDTDPLPKPVVMEGNTECVESVEYMRANHMKLLDQWRDEVVREGNRTYVNSAGKTFEKSLTKTCLDCHANKEDFCEQCHKQVSVEPYCWQCHVVPNARTASMLIEKPSTLPDSNSEFPVSSQAIAPSVAASTNPHLTPR